jgi:hypothetical protein
VDTTTLGRGHTGETGRFPGCWNVEADVQDVALWTTAVPFPPTVPAALLHFGARAGVDQVAPGDHLAADEAARDVGVDLARGFERGTAAAQRPRARLGRADREEGDQSERLLEPLGHLLERGRAVAEGSGFLLGQLAELALEQKVDSARAVLDDHHRLRRQRLEGVGDLAVVVGDRPAGAEHAPGAPRGP